VNLHTAANSNGEIRGQLSPRVVPMDAFQETPVNFSTGSSGYVLTAIDTAANVLGYDVHITALSGPETLAHIHGYAGLGSIGDVVQTLPLGPRKIGTWTYPVANEPDVLLGRTYFNSHTGLNPGGEIRGQVLFLPGADALLGVDGPPRALPRLSAAPNPFGNHTSLTFYLSRTGTVSLAIVGVDGRLVRRVEPAIFAPGPHSYVWDGFDDQGHPAAPGVYFATARTPEGTITTRIARIQ
jgi:CHRD domain-containing protein/flagellar hook capping protein FlgD